MDNEIKINGENLLLFENVKTKENVLNAFWKWIEFMDKDNYKKAVESIYWDKNKPILPKDFKERVTTFFQIDGQPLDVVYPCQELKDMVENEIEVEWDEHQKPDKNYIGSCVLHIPVTNDKIEAKKSTKAGLWGVATSFFICEYQGKLLFEFIIFLA